MTRPTSSSSAARPIARLLAIVLCTWCVASAPAALAGARAHGIQTDPLRAPIYEPAGDPNTPDEVVGGFPVRPGTHVARSDAGTIVTMVWLGAWSWLHL